MAELLHTRSLIIFAEISNVASNFGGARFDLETRKLSQYSN
jgi:hypothetical protein